jgi:hypothetical protein
MKVDRPSIFIILRSDNSRQGDTTMRFMVLVKGCETMGSPPQAFLDAVAKAGEEAMRAGTLIETGGLFPSATGARVRLRKGALDVRDGPFSESKEVVGGWGIVEAESKDEAVDGVVRLLELHKQYWPGWEGEAEVRQMFPQGAPSAR